MKSLVVLSAIILVIVCVPRADAHTFVYNLTDGTPVFSMQFPDGWRLDLDFDPPEEGIDAPPPPRVVEAIPKDGAKLWLGAWVLPEVPDIIQAREYFDSLEQYILNDVIVEEVRNDDLNGMPAKMLTGTAKKGKEPVEWAIALFQAGAKLVAAVLYIGVPEARQHRGGELKAIVSSLRPPG